MSVNLHKPAKTTCVQRPQFVGPYGGLYIQRPLSFNATNNLKVRMVLNSIIFSMAILTALVKQSAKIHGPLV